MSNIYLIGFMGTGKTTLGKAISEKLDRRFSDLDDLIEARENRKITDIFMESGEEYFRNVESQVIFELTSQKGLVVATGGGAVINPSNYSNFKKSGTIITLVASPETIYERVKDSSHRPLLNVPNPLDEIKKLLFERAYHYIKSDFIVDTSDKSIDETVDEIVELIK